MAGAGYNLFVAGQKLTAAQVNTYLMQQSVMQFADASARNTALSAVLDEMLLSSQADSNSLTVYSGSAWSTIGPVHGAWTTWTPAVVQSGSVSVTNTASRYMRMGRLVIATFELSVTGSGTGANDVTVTVPVAAAGNSANYHVGTGKIFDVSAGASGEFTNRTLVLASTTTCKFANTATGGTLTYLGSTSFTAGLASGDTIAGTLMYEAAGDA